MANPFVLQQEYAEYPQCIPFFPLPQNDRILAQVLHGKTVGTYISTIQSGQPWA